MKEGTLKLIDSFFNSKTAVTIVTILFAGQAGYIAYDKLSVPDIPQAEIVVAEKTEKPEVICDITGHIKRDH